MALSTIIQVIFCLFKRWTGGRCSKSARASLKSHFLITYQDIESSGSNMESEWGFWVIDGWIGRWIDGLPFLNGSLSSLSSPSCSEAVRKSSSMDETERLVSSSAARWPAKRPCLCLSCPDCSPIRNLLISKTTLFVWLGRRPQEQCTRQTSAVLWFWNVHT